MKNIYVILVALVAMFAAAGCNERPAETVRDIHPEWSYHAVMYELNTRQFTDEGTFRAAEGHLPRLRELGVDIIWFMPIHPIGVEERKGELGSYYSISDYKAVNPEFGTMEDFKHFVAEAHRHGFKVLMDWVPNHTSRDAVWTSNLDWYDLDENGSPVAPYDWTDVSQLDFGNEEMRDAMIDAMLYWVREADIDGYRCDYAVGPPLEFWDKAISILKDEKADLFMLAEAESPELHTEGGFDASYAWEAHHIMNRLAQEEYPIDSLRSYIAREKRRYPADAIRLQFTSNHDENSWNGTEFERMGDAYATFAAFTYVLPGMPLVYNGQEVGLDRRLEFFVKDSIEWQDRGGFTDLYKSLNALKHRNAALAAGEKGGELVEIETSNPTQVYAFSREAGGDKVVCIFNFSSRQADVTVGTDEMSLAPWEFVILED
ncbi:MAG: alpha-amylase [Alistipes sp.]|nr:alpha-amylase [Alistipes sp.]